MFASIISHNYAWTSRACVYGRPLNNMEGDIQERVKSTTTKKLQWKESIKQAEE